MTRAVWSNMAHGTAQGASTITQQYVRNAYLTQDRTLQRKAQEAALAIQVERRRTKDEILCGYLNTIYYGRSAYGIQAAAVAYFGTDVDRLDLAQALVLVAVIKDPTGLDPASDEVAAMTRWRWILAAMVERGAVDGTAAAALQYPTVLPERAHAGATGLIVSQVERELAKNGVAAQLLRTGGLQVVTTIDQTAQRAVESAVADGLRGQPDALKAALVAVDPATGAIRAYYGGTKGAGFFDDAAAPRSPAGTFLPVVLAAALEAGVNAEASWPGPRSCGPCSLKSALPKSLTAPYLGVTEKLGPDRVAEQAFQLGVQRVHGDRPALSSGDARPSRTAAAIATGSYPVSPLEMAVVYAAIAHRGISVERHFVDQVRAMNWTPPMYPHRRAVRATTATRITDMLVRDASEDLLDGRPAAVKSGNKEWDRTFNQDVWLAGYTSELASVVWVGRDKPGPLRDVDGSPVTSDTLPRAIWRSFMTSALADRPPTVNQ
ncbi:transglycosylase domain-containing protein [Dactylosporangium sp. NPDC000555]|uniref:transglycosylase domain-containing protein n=1 Tax=Dactylosporangium sp. NPDC000555 TaxID=3154260 RepID=UPI00332F6A20